MTIMKLTRSPAFDAISYITASVGSLSPPGHWAPPNFLGLRGASLRRPNTTLVGEINNFNLPYNLRLLNRIQEATVLLSLFPGTNSAEMRHMFGMRLTGATDCIVSTNRPGGYMKTHRLFHVMISLLFLSMYSIPLKAENLTSYHKGQTWTISAIYKQAMLNSETWSSPVIWKYHVEKLDKNKNDTIATIRVSDPTGLRTENITIRYNITQDRLEEVVSRFKQQDKLQTITQTFDHSPADGLDTPISSVPYFMLGRNRAAGKSLEGTRKTLNIRKADSTEVEQLKTEKEFGLLKNANSEQSLAIDKHLLPENLKILEVEDAHEHIQLFQVWEDGKPWPIYSVSHGCKAYLIESETN
jgi:hypothetical protein